MFRTALRVDQRGKRVAGFAAMILLLATTPAAHADEHDHLRHVDGTESMPPAPTGRESARLQALNPGQPTVETTSDSISATAVTFTVWAKIAGDEEYRSYFGSDWSNIAVAGMEAADNKLYANWGIDFVRFASYSWYTDPDTSRAVCNTSNDLLDELIADIPTGSADVVLGYSKNANSGSKGCAAGNHAVYVVHGSTVNERAYNQWVTIQHEISHFYGAPDRYPDTTGGHTNDVMENQYLYPDLWCTVDGGIISENVTKYN